MNKTATYRNIGFPRGVQPGSRHATAAIITGLTFMRKALCNLIQLLIFISTGARLVTVNDARLVLSFVPKHFTAMVVSDV